MVLVVGVALLFWTCVFMVYFTQAGTTPLEFFLGRYEPLPPDLGTWKEAGLTDDGSRREERRLLPDGRVDASYLLLQVRYRHPTTGAIVRSDPEKRLPRRRVGRGA